MQEIYYNYIFIALCALIILREFAKRFRGEAMKPGAIIASLIVGGLMAYATAQNILISEIQPRLSAWLQQLFH